MVKVYKDNVKYTKEENVKGTKEPKIRYGWFANCFFANCFLRCLISLIDQRTGSNEKTMHI